MQTPVARRSARLRSGSAHEECLSELPFTPATTRRHKTEATTAPIAHASTPGKASAVAESIPESSDPESAGNTAAATPKVKPAITVTANPEAPPSSALRRSSRRAPVRSRGQEVCTEQTAGGSTRSASAWDGLQTKALDDIYEDESAAVAPAAAEASEYPQGSYRIRPPRDLANRTSQSVPLSLVSKPASPDKSLPAPVPLPETGPSSPASKGPNLIAAYSRAVPLSLPEQQQGATAGLSIDTPLASSIADEDPYGGDVLRRLAAGLPAVHIPSRHHTHSSIHIPGQDTTNSSSDESCSDSADSISSAEDDPDGAEEAAALRWVPRSKLPSVRAMDQVGDSLAATASRRSEAMASMAVMPPLDARAAERAARKAAPDTAGRRWFDLPATPITPEVKTDLRLLALRGAFDPKRFYRNPDATKFPKYFQMGTVVEGPTDFYSGRMTKSERKQTLTEELLADSRLVDTHKRRFGRLQAERSKFSKRKGGVRKTSNPRLNKRPAKPRH